jgi:uncharacterized lipoprotein
MNKIVQRFSLLLLAVFTAACAYSPQRITLEPRLTVTGEAYGNGRPIIVTGSDQRQNRVVGAVGGVYGSSATITVANNLEAALASAANALLASKGFVVNSPDPSALQLTIVVEEISYTPVEAPVGSDVKLRTVLRAEVTKGGESFSGRYQSESQHKSVTKPDAEHNQEWFNELLSNTLTRMFDDPKLRAFLVQ